jgi:hypothetical protein
MKTFTKMAAQGDFIILRIADIPSNVEPIAPDQGKIVVAHSETGHNHVMEAERVTAFKEAGTKDVDLYKMFLNVEAPTEINHLRSFDTHETLLVPPGKYEIRRQREYVAEGFRRAQD